MAIAFDASANGSETSSATLTFSHTCSGENRILYAGFVFNGATLDMTGVTYNSVPMTKVDEIVGATNTSTYLWRLVNPSTGANDIAATCSTTKAPLLGVSASYTGVLQTSPQGDSDTTVVTSGTSITDNLTTVKDNEWYMMVAGSGQTLTASTGTERTSISGGGKDSILIDSNTAKTPPGAVTLQATHSSSESTSVAESFAPSLDSGLQDTHGFFLA